MNIEFYIERDIKECEKLWREFSLNRHISDIWEYRLCFHRGYGSLGPYFIVGKIAQEIIGFIPLEYQDFKKRYIFFGGGDWNENFTFYIKNHYKKFVLPLFFKQLPKNTKLFFINNEESSYTDFLKEDDSTYFLNPVDYNYEIEEYLKTLSHKTRKNLNREIREVEKLKPEIIYDNFQDIDVLIFFNKKRFGPDSAFEEPGFEKSLRLLLGENSLKGKVGMLSICIGGEAVAVFLVLKNGQIVEAMQSGSDPDRKGIAKFLVITLINKYFNEKVDRINFFAHDCGWKEHWRLKKDKLFMLDASAVS